MTTIAYKNGLIAFDSRLGHIGDGTLITDDYMKMEKVDEVFFFFVGGISHVEKLISAYMINEIKTPIECNAIVLDGDDLFYIGVDPNEGKPYVWKEPLKYIKCDSWGSGQDHARTAMDMGCDAAKAIAIAAKRDLYTGGTIRVFSVKEKKIIQEIKEY